MTRRQLLLAAVAAQARPNVVLILADDLGSSDLSSYGARDLRTPHIDSLGRDGARFSHFYANAPECSPTRAALMTGRYQQRVGGLECAIGVGNVGRYDEAVWLAERGELGLPPEETSIAAMLKKSGYDTCCSGKWHLGYGDRFSANRHGFDEYFGILGGNADYFTHREDDGTNVLYHNGKPVERTGYITDLFADHAIEWLSRRSRSKPFFLYLPFTAPHSPLQGPKGGASTGRRATYIEMVEHMDRRIGDVLAQLDRIGASSNTVVVFMSDNGGPIGQGATNTPLRGAKSGVFEGGLRVPCLIRWRGVVRPDTVCDQVAITMDLTATLLAAAGIKPARPLDGVDLAPVLTGKRKPAARTLYWSYKRADNRRYAVRDGDWKYAIDNRDEFLFHLRKDPGEKNNLLASESKIVASMKSKLEDWKRATAPARLRGFLRSAPQE